MPILFLIGGFHLDHLYKWHVTLDVTLCMKTPFMKTPLSLFCIVFTLRKAYIVIYWMYANI
jgi:hypothetical protein